MLITKQLYSGLNMVFQYNVLKKQENTLEINTDKLNVEIYEEIHDCSFIQSTEDITQPV